MKIRAKLLLAVLPIVLFSISALGIWHYNTVATEVERSNKLYLDSMVDTFISNEIERRHTMLVSMNVSDVPSFITQYQKEVFSSATKIMELQEGDFGIFDADNNPLFCSSGLKTTENLCDITLPVSTAKDVDSLFIKTGEKQKVFLYVSRLFDPWSWKIIFAIDGSSIDETRGSIFKTTLVIAVLVLVAIISVIFGLTFQIFLSPIDKLSSAVQAVASGEKLNEISVKSKDELGRLARGMETMAKDIFNARNELEQRVNERTLDLYQKNQLLQTLDYLRYQFIKSSNPFDFYPNLLEKLLKVTDSEYGFIGEVLYDEVGSPYMKAYALSNLSWDKDTSKLYEEYKNKGFEFKKLDNLFGHVITTGKSVISNDPLNDPRGSGFPKGHPLLSSFIGIPVYFGTKLVGEIGLANRPNGYDEKVLEFISPVIEACGQIINAHRERQARLDAEEKLIEYKDSLEKIVDERTVDLRAALQAAEKSNKAKSIFLANMSHELRTPMHAVLSFSNLALKKVEDEKVIHYLENIVASGTRLTTLLNDLLDLSKLEAGRMDIEFKEVDIIQLIQGTIEEVKSLLEDKFISIKVNANSQCRCVLDQKLFTQVIMNLFSNSIKFSPDNSTIRVNINCTETKLFGKLQDIVELAIIDEGIGIPKDELNSIFEQFEQSTKTTSAAGGTGLGLSITRSIVRLHKGKIWAESPPEGWETGSAFIIQIPTYQDADLSS